jgi:hypothetical protein
MNDHEKESDPSIADNPAQTKGSSNPNWSANSWALLFFYLPCRMAAFESGLFVIVTAVLGGLG